MSGSQPLLSVADLRNLASLLGGGALMALLPQSLDPALSRALLRVERRIRPSQSDRIARRMYRALADRSHEECVRLAETHALMRLEDMLGRTRGIRHFAWKPQLRIQGLDRLEQALDRGSGAVLWSMRLSSATALKQAFHQAGRPLVHLSEVTHGARSKSRFAVAAVAPLFCRAENCYLAERVQIPRDGSLAYLKKLAHRLKANAPVSIFGEHRGRQNVEAPLLGHPRPFALGAPSVAWQNGAALFTAACFREGPFRYRIEIDEEIPVPADVPRKEFAAAAVHEYARRLESHIRCSPPDWQGWSYNEFPGED